MIALLWFKQSGRWDHEGASKKEELQRVKEKALSHPLIDKEVIDSFQKLEQQEAKRNRTIWAKEQAAQRHEAIFIRLWNDLNRSDSPLRVLAQFPFKKLLLQQDTRTQTHRHGIKRLELTGNKQAWSPPEWKTRLRQWRQEGYTIEQSEWRHAAFEVDSSTQQARSTIWMSVHVKNSKRPERLIIQGDLSVTWEKAKPGDNRLHPSVIDASQITITRRQAKPAFKRVFADTVPPQAKSGYIDPLIAHDLNQDGQLEIILAASNRVYRRQKDGRFVADQLCRFKEEPIFTGLMIELNRDSHADFLCVDKQGLLLYTANSKGEFDRRPKRVWKSDEPIQHGEAITAGDIDHDNDLDIWLGQYKAPYTDGQMPTPYYDANDGYPSYLLINQGNGQFTNQTRQRGLTTNRFRRVYSGSLADIDQDRDLDLVVVSDFAGADLFLNQGNGTFREATTSLMDEPHAFGMAHTFGDFNQDGHADLFMIGMNSWTASRLEHLGLGHPDYPDYNRMRAPMTFGNRLYLWDENGDGFKQPPFQRPLNHTGWSWGTDAFDFDNSGTLDIYIANGHKTKASVREYEPHFWLHDIYVGTSKPSLVNDLYFRSTHEESRNQLNRSYGGYEKNRLLFNSGNLDYLEIAYLMGVALEADSQNVLAEDIDNDGRQDLIVTTSEQWPQKRKRLLVFRNTLSTDHHWIGFRFRSREGGPSPIGSTVTVETASGHLVRHLVTGESYRCQPSNTVHFGLGKQDSVKTVTIRWPNGDRTQLHNPEVDRYHPISPLQPASMSRDQ